MISDQGQIQGKCGCSSTPPPPPPKVETYDGPDVIISSSQDAQPYNVTYWYFAHNINTNKPAGRGYLGVALNVACASCTLILLVSTLMYP